MIRSRRFRSASVATVLAGSLVLGSCTTAEAGSTPLAWSPCPTDPALQCTELVVPVDRADPGGPTFRLPVVRVPAAKPEQRLGSLVLNRGGPGYSAVDYITGIRAGSIPSPVSPAVYDRYDVIAIDPRGAGGSQPAVRCAASAEEATALARSVPGIPVTDAERSARTAADARFVQGCVEHSGAILPHISSDEVARDMDALRGALGEDRLHFVGQSYGTFLGTVYANLFPDRVGRFVLDSVVDPAVVTGEPGSLRGARVGADTASAAAMAEFLRLCAAGGERCAFGAGDPAGAWERLLARLKASPVPLTAPDGQTVRLGYSEVVSWTGSWLYQPAVWEQPGAGAAFLAVAQAAIDDPAGPNGMLMAQILVGLRDNLNLTVAPYGGALNATAFAVNCLETDAPGGPAAHAAATAARDAAVPHFGALRAWADSVCAQWPVRGGGYRGPWEVRTAEPVLIVNSRFDPVTPLAAAQRLLDLLPGSALLVHEGPGHVAAQQSRCVVETASAYLVDGAVPAPGTTCAPDRVPFA